MTTKLTGFLYALPVSREFELHQVDGPVIHGNIDAEFDVELLHEYTGSGMQCAIIVTGQPPVLKAVGAP